MYRNTQHWIRQVACYIAVVVAVLILSLSPCTGQEASGKLVWKSVV